MTALKQIFLNFNWLNKRARLLKKGDKVLIAVSGGSDSMALLHFLKILKKKFSLELAVAHVHHGLQKQNDAALKLVRKTCLFMGVPFYFMKTDLKKVSKKEKRSLEDTGRLVRYSFFESTARSLGVNKIATAHTLDDEAETLLSEAYASKLKQYGPDNPLMLNVMEKMRELYHKTGKKDEAVAMKEKEEKILAANPQFRLAPQA